MRTHRVELKGVARVKHVGRELQLQGDLALQDVGVLDARVAHESTLDGTGCSGVVADQQCICGAALADRETPLWLEAGLDRQEVRDFLRFHAGAPIVHEREAAAFAVIIAGGGDPFAGFAIGTDTYNQALSEKRARTVADALRTRGVKGTLSAKGFGESRPVAPNELNGRDNPAGRQLNRRVEIFVKA